MNVIRHAIVHGRVQGVGYRAWTANEADTLGLAGFVRNRRDGSVEAAFSGDAEIVARMIERLWQGPPSAKVNAVDVTDGEAQLLGLRHPGENFSMLTTV
jgi:acylphosphatase